MHNNNYFYIHRILPPYDTIHISSGYFEVIRPLFKVPNNVMKLYTLLLHEKPYDFRGQQDEKYCSKQPILLSKQQVSLYIGSKQEFQSCMLSLFRLGYITQRNTNTFDFYEAPIHKMKEIIATTPDHFSDKELKDHQAILNSIQ